MLFITTLISALAAHTVAAPAPAPEAAAAAAMPAGAYKRLALAHHNVHRANHSAPNVTWNATLAATAMKIAKTCVWAHSMNVDGGGYGQNLAAGNSIAQIGSSISDLWYNGEMPNFAGLYGQAQPSYSNFDSWGHFSQVVWKDVQTIGCATYNCVGGMDGIPKNSGIEP